MSNRNLFIGTFSFILLVSTLIMSSCSKDAGITEPHSANVNEEGLFYNEKVILGKKLENPYTVENMKKAYTELKREYTEKSSSGEDIDIRTTHLYIRFLPANLEEYNILTGDTTLELFEYPLDYEIEEGGTEYHDPELQENQITWQYCAVPVNFKFPDIEYEIIEELYLPEEDEEVDFEKSGDNMTFIDFLEMKAMLITKNITEIEYKECYEKGRRKWNPEGKIQLYDDGIGVNKNIPLQGAKARVYSWFTIKSDLTDSNGKFYINTKFKGHVNYSIKWERADYELRNKRWGQAYYNGPRYKNRDWNLTINNGMSRAYAIVHKAAQHYFYENIDGLRRPPKRSDQIGRITIGVFDWNNAGGGDAIGGDHLAFKRATTFPEIRIFRWFYWNLCEYRSSLPLKNNIADLKFL